jgi:hypothetical protein
MSNPTEKHLSPLQGLGFFANLFLQVRFGSVSKIENTPLAYARGSDCGA